MDTVGGLLGAVLALLIVGSVSPSANPLAQAERVVFLLGLALTMLPVMYSEVSLIFLLVYAPFASPVDFTKRLHPTHGDVTLRHVTSVWANTSAILCGISLATVAFVASNGRHLSSLWDSTGVGLMLGAAVLFAWAMALLLGASIPGIEDELTRQAVKRAYWLFGSAVFVLYGGLVWSLAALSPFLFVMAAAAYVLAYWLIMVGSGPQSTTPARGG